MRHRSKGKIAFLLVLIILLGMIITPGEVAAVGKAGQVVKITASTYNVRSGPGTNYEAYGQVVANSYFTILDVVQGDGRTWYKIPYRGTTAYIVVNPNNQKVMNSSGPFKKNVPVQNNITDPAFEKEIAGFPDSYKPALRYLHSRYPKWKFVPAPTSNNWTTSIDLQMQDLRSNTTQYRDDSAFHERYLYMVRNWQLIDAGNNYPSNRAGISYFMDPRNFLNETDIFQFEQLTFDPTVHNINVVKAILGSNPQLLELAPALMTAARETGVSPYLLASRMKLEITKDTKTIINSARGDIDLAWPPLFSGDKSISFLEPEDQLKQLERYIASGKKLNASQQEAYDNLKGYFEWEALEHKLFLETPLTAAEKSRLEYFRVTRPAPIAEPVTKYYNLFNIQATPSTGVVDGNRINGVIYAAGKVRSGNGLVNLGEATVKNSGLPWTSPEAAAIGGAKFMGRGYILNGQDTLYHQKYNVNGAVWHQYMSNLSAPYSEGRSVANAYRQMGILSTDEFVFRIPVFQDMPSSTAIPEVISLNISNIPGEEPGSEMQLIDPDDIETKPVETPQVPLDVNGNPINNGDINGDGHINSADRLILTRYLLNLTTLEGVQKRFADVNGDGLVNSADRLIMTRYILGLGDLPR